MTDYDEDTISRIWEHARATGDYDPDEWREDECGAWIRRSQYGHVNDEFGWKIQPTRPGFEDLRPFHVRNDFDISIGRPHCRVVADRENVPSTAHVGQPRNRTAGARD